VKDLLDLARPDLRAFEPYGHAAWAPGLERLHANEMPWRAQGDNSTAGLNRYPEPQPADLIDRLAELYGIAPDYIVAGRGSDEAIDLLVRAFCRAGIDSVLVCPPTFGMYRVAAQIQAATVIEVPLLAEQDFALDAAAVVAAARNGVKLVFLCSPNNPTGKSIDALVVERVCEELAECALVVVDEAYVEFSRQGSLVARLQDHANLVLLRTLSKAYALAGARCGALLADPRIVDLLKRIIPPYALPAPTVEAVMQLTAPPQRLMAHARVTKILAERERVRLALQESPLIQRIWSSDANFLLLRVTDTETVVALAARAGLIIRDVGRQRALRNCLRVTIGTPEQNDRLLGALAPSALGVT